MEGGMLCATVVRIVRLSARPTVFVRKNLPNRWDVLPRPEPRNVQRLFQMNPLPTASEKEIDCARGRASTNEPTYRCKWKTSMRKRYTPKSMRVLLNPTMQNLTNCRTPGR